MAFPSQFSLSLELTRLIPLIAQSKTFESLISLARALQSSGSDIVIEEDLTEIFGRARIDHRLASSFKAVVGKTTSSSLCEGISLDSGPGPTVSRGFAKGQDQYFATIVQCSLLTSSLRKASLAAAIKQFFEKQAEEAPPGHILRASPSEEGILGVLRACEEQTSSFNWQFVISAVANTLGVLNRVPCKPLPTVIFRGLVTMLPLVQRFPEDRMIHIDIDATDTVCLIVVWAHHVLGLTVLVKNYLNNNCQQTEFGSGIAQLVIDIRSVVPSMLKESSITLMESSLAGKNEELLRLEPDPDEFKIDAIYNLPANGYAKKILEAIAFDFTSFCEAVVEVMTQVTCCFAITVARKLKMTDTWNQGYSLLFEDGLYAGLDLDQFPLDGREGLVFSDAPYPISEQRIFEAAELLFGTTKLSRKSIEEYVQLYRGKRWDHEVEPPRQIAAILNQQAHSRASWREAVWPRLVDAVKYLSILILAFAHIQDLQSSAEVPLSFEHEIPEKHSLARALSQWSGDDWILVTELTWYHAIALLVTGHDLKIDPTADSSCLISDRGWSIYLATFLQPNKTDIIRIRDPSYVNPGYVVIKRGVPSRNGVRKHAILDGPDKGHLKEFEWQRVEAAQEFTTLRCADKVFYGRPYYGERQDSFVVTLRFSADAYGKTLTRRTGYGELFSALWMIHKTIACHHSTPQTTRLLLPPGCSTICGFGDLDGAARDTDEDSCLDWVRVLICLTANDSNARWRALLAIAHSRRYGSLERSRKVLLRASNCCFECAIDQTAALTGKWFIVL